MNRKLKINVFIKDQNKCFSIVFMCSCIQCLRQNFHLGHIGLIKDVEFKNAIYSIDMGQNDMADSFFYSSIFLVSSIGKVSYNCIRDLEFNHCLHQKLISVLV